MGANGFHVGFSSTEQRSISSQLNRFSWNEVLKGDKYTFNTRMTSTSPGDGAVLSERLAHDLLSHALVEILHVHVHTLEFVHSLHLHLIMLRLQLTLALTLLLRSCHVQLRRALTVRHLLTRQRTRKNTYQAIRRSRPGRRKRVWAATASRLCLLHVLHGVEVGLLHFTQLKSDLLLFTT